MRPHRRRRTSTILAIAFATAGLGLVSSPASAAECPELPCVVVTYVQTIDGTETPLGSRAFGPADLTTLSDQKPALNGRKYTLRKNPASKGGKIQTRPIAQGKRVGISALLADPELQKLGKPTFVETPNVAGIPAVLSQSEIVDPDATSTDGTAPPGEYPFFEKLQPAVFLTASGKLGYVRPLRDLDEDTNAADYFQVTDRLDITVHTTGTLLSPTVTSSAGTALERGDKTTFSVSIAEKTAIKSVVWDFGDGSVKNTKRTSPTKAYAKKGTYPVAAMVRTNDGSYGRSPAVEVKVANPPKAPSSGTGGGDGLGGGGGTGDSGGFGGGSTLPPYDPYPTDISPPDEFEEPPVVEDELEPPAPVDDGLVPVEGFVLAGAEIVPGGTPETIPGTENTATPAPASQQELRTRIATWIVVAFAAALLMSLGALSETRWFRDRLRHLRRRA